MLRPLSGGVVVQRFFTPWVPYIVIDGLGDAAINPITVQATALINGQPSVVINGNAWSVAFLFDTVTWSAV